MAKSTQMVQRMGRQVFLQAGPHFPITHPSFRKMKKQSRMEVYFKPLPSGTLHTHGTEVSERLIASFHSPLGRKLLPCEANSDLYSTCHVLAPSSWLVKPTIQFNIQELGFILEFCSDSKFISMELKQRALTRYFRGPRTQEKKSHPFTV